MKEKIINTLQALGQLFITKQELVYITIPKTNPIKYTKIHQQ